MNASEFRKLTDLQERCDEISAENRRLRKTLQWVADFCGVAVDEEHTWAFCEDAFESLETAARDTLNATGGRDE